MDEVFLLQILHSRGDLCGHIEKHHSVHLLTVTLTQIIQQIPMSHELCDDVKGRFPCTHACHDTQTHNVCKIIQTETINVCCDVNKHQTEHNLLLLTIRVKKLTERACD